MNLPVVTDCYHPPSPPPHIEDKGVGWVKFLVGKVAKEEVGELEDEARGGFQAYEEVVDWCCGSRL